MYCNYNALAECAIKLNKNFKEVSKSISNIENSVSLINSYCHSDTRDYFYEKFQKLQDDFDIITNQFQNINQYIDQVINNYKSAENDMMNIFGG